MRKYRVLLMMVLLLAGGTAQASKKNVRPDEIAALQKSGKVASFEQLNQAALAKHPGSIIGDTALRKKDDRYDYRVKLKDSSGQAWNLKLDAASAAVLTDRKVVPPVLPSNAGAATPPPPPQPAVPVPPAR